MPGVVPTRRSLLDLHLWHRRVLLDLDAVSLAIVDLTLFQCMYICGLLAFNVHCSRVFLFTGTILTHCCSCTMPAWSLHDVSRHLYMLPHSSGLWNNPFPTGVLLVSCGYSAQTPVVASHCPTATASVLFPVAHIP
ncbi:hypothetical protein DENSPDRAFT_232454 [Dentipellis sp. KUC8613]|nr:hypothetical protein DENSPDRAFT_232454 [Dentipellis sp. KUC8613]